MDGWTGGGRGSICLHTHTHTHIQDKIRYQSRQIAFISDVWPIQNMFISRRVKGNLGLFWWWSTLVETGCSCFPSIYACNYKTGPHIVKSHQVCYGPWEMFIARTVRGASIHSTLCSVFLFDRVMMGFHFGEDCHYTNWGFEGVTICSTNSGRNWAGDETQTLP